MKARHKLKRPGPPLFLSSLGKDSPFAIIKKVYFFYMKVSLKLLSELSWVVVGRVWGGIDPIGPWPLLKLKSLFGFARRGLKIGLIFFKIIIQRIHPHVQHNTVNLPLCILSVCNGQGCLVTAFPASICSAGLG